MQVMIINLSECSITDENQKYATAQKRAATTISYFLWADGDIINNIKLGKRWAT